jgi:ATP-dependent helicase HrpA
VNARDHIYRKFTQVLAQYMPFDLVIDEHTADGTEARVSKTSVAGSWGAIAGDLRYFADRSGIPRAAIEGTQIPMDLIRRNATRGKSALVYDPRRKHGPLMLKRTVDYFGFELESEVETVEEFPPELAKEARHILAEALARGEARHFAVKKNREAIDEIREAYKRSGGETKRLGLPELTALYEEQLADVGSMDDFRAAQLIVNKDMFVPRDGQERLARLPDQVTIRDRDVDIDYDVEERDGGRRGVARLRLPEKIARSLTEAEIPKLDRPVRFVVLRGQRGAVRADTLDELQERLTQPWSPDEVEESADDRAMLSQAERNVREIAGEFRRHRRASEHRHGARHGSRRGPRGSGQHRGGSNGGRARDHGGPGGRRRRGR